MRKVYSIIIIAMVLVIGYMLSLRAYTNISMPASTYFVTSTTSKEIRDDYHSSSRGKQFSVLIVPGHEPDFGGTEYGSIKERDIVLMIADELEKVLKEDNNIKTYRTRDEKGWVYAFDKYFKDNYEDIVAWVVLNKKITSDFIEDGLISKVSKEDSIQHNSAPSDVATRLYGINKWSNENDIDVVLHLHINDTPRKNTSVAGPYVGFAIYVPEKQYSNAKASKEIGESLKNRLEDVMNVSNMPKESVGVIESQQLIAMGSYNTSDAASLLIEYGYIYETQYTIEVSQRQFAKLVAEQTYQGLRDFLRKK